MTTLMLTVLDGFSIRTGQFYKKIIRDPISLNNLSIRVDTKFDKKRLIISLPLLHRELIAQGTLFETDNTEENIVTICDGRLVPYQFQHR